MLGPGSATACVEHHVESHRAGLDLFPADRADSFGHCVVLQVEIESLPCHQLLVAVWLRTEEIVEIIRVSHHVLLYALLSFVLGSTQITDMQLALGLGLGHNLRQDLSVLRGVPTLRELGEVDVEAVHGVQSSIALETFELSEG